MNSPKPQHPWQRLAAAARQSPDERDTSAPYGFATRVAAMAEMAPHRAGSLFERFALRAVGLAAVLAIGSAVFTLTQAPSAAGSGADTTEAADDPLSQLVDA